MCKTLCHHLVPQGPVAAANLKETASNSSGLDDGWPLAWCIAAAFFPEACMACVWSSDLRFLCIATRPWSPDLLSGCNYDPLHHMADSEWWASLSMGRKSDSPMVQQPLHWGTLLSRPGIHSLYICSVNDRIQCYVKHNLCYTGLSVMQNTCTLAFAG